MLALLAFVAHASFATTETCTYATWDWDTNQKKAVNARQVTKSRADLTPEERGTTPGCTVCEEDQVSVQVGALPTFKVCRAWRDRVHRALASAAGFPIATIVGYRVGKSKGPLNAAGQRTQFSNHSYGVALDINSETNGLYEACVRFGPECKLVRGGAYRPEEPGAITKTSSLYHAMTVEGFKWGGEIGGRQKDFMHFSPDGM